ncbi:helix-hairpin-helix domain-containing protein [Reyranella sp.]|jgi:DNA uptake protein ComE-like DNA-binding protein|uniref:ComEA family DNA-binding protein n=1 Tax=Reyranella sp. TaxID=1929291 RepID=UPI002F949252
MSHATRTLELLALLLGLGLLFATSAGAQTRPAPASPAAALVDLNSANRDQLMGLEGIGEVRADAIIRARPFKAKTELVERHIIPEALYEKIADKLIARAVPAAPPARPAKPPAQAVPSAAPRR